MKGVGCLCPETSPAVIPIDPERDSYPQSAYHLLSRLLDLDPSTRITAEQALNHPFITSSS
jgi:cell division control protein 7